MAFKFLIGLLFLAYLTLVGFASYKIAKSKLSDTTKFYWMTVMIAFNLPAMLAFIIYHDFIMPPEKRSGK